MSDALIAVLFGLATALSWGFADFWAARASKTIGPVTTLVMSNVLVLAAYVPVYLLLSPNNPLTTVGVWFALAAGCLINLAALFLYKGLAIGPVSLVSPLAASYPLITTMVALFVFGARLSVRQIVAIVIIVLGVMAIAGLFSIRRSERRLARGPLLGMTGAIFYGVGFACLAQAAARIGWQQTALLEFVALLVSSLVLIPVVQGNERVLRRTKQALTNRYIIGNGLVGMGGLVVFNIGVTFEQSSGAVVAAVSACYPALTITLALRHFKEEVKLVPLAGAAVSIAGIVILSLS